MWQGMLSLWQSDKYEFLHRHSIKQSVSSLTWLKSIAIPRQKDLVGEYYAAVGNPFEDPIYMHLIHHDI